MKIRQILYSGKRSISFEFFPPKTDDGVTSLFKTIHELKVHQPDYVSVTYGAGGSTRARTMELVCRIKEETGLETMSHVTCVAQTKEDVHGILARLEEAGIDNILALGGDPPRGDPQVEVDGGFRHAYQLMTHIRKNFDFGVAGSSFPEGHPDSKDLDTDMDYHKKKVESGADFLITQLFFDNRDFFDFMDRVAKAGIDVPILPGILPILSTPQIRRFAALCRAKIPPALDDKLERYAEDDDTVREIGIEHSTTQIEDLWRNGVPGIHLYTLNKSYSTSKILDNLSLSRE